ncbi:MAG: DUF1801 domain-containing protein [Fluviicola sp.]
MNSVDDYYNALPEERKRAMFELRKTISENLPEGFTECIAYNMPSFVVPHSLYPQGYHCDPKILLPFISLASQKNFISLYHMGIYANNELLSWFENAYKELNIGKLNMGKSCIRFKKIDSIPYDLIAELSKKQSPQQWIELYESSFVKK